MEKKLRKYINRKFSLYPKTNEILEVREELYTIMLDKYSDCISMNMTQDDSYRSAIEMMADYKQAVKEVETGSSLPALKKNIITTIAISSFYFILLTFIYLLISMAVLKTFNNTWLIAVGGAFAYLVYLALKVYEYAKLFSLKRLTRLGIGLIYLTAIPVLYIFPSIYMQVLYTKNVWSFSWIIVIVIFILYLLTDCYVYRKELSVIEKSMHLIGSGLLITTVLYLSISARFNLWGVAWIIYVAYLGIVSLAIYIGEKKGIFNI